LEGKGLVTRTSSPSTKQTIVSIADPPALPAWEREARTEEAFAARCSAAIIELRDLAHRAGRRASQLRLEHRAPDTSDERAADVARWCSVMLPPPSPEFGPRG